MFVLCRTELDCKLNVFFLYYLASRLRRLDANMIRFTYRHGAQNAYDAPSKQTLESEFGTDNEDEVMIRILEHGDLQETEVSLPFPRPFF